MGELEESGDGFTRCLLNTRLHADQMLRHRSRLSDMTDDDVNSALAPMKGIVRVAPLTGQQLRREMLQTLLSPARGLPVVKERLRSRLEGFPKDDMYIINRSVRARTRERRIFFGGVTCPALHITKEGRTLSLTLTSEKRMSA